MFFSSLDLTGVLWQATLKDGTVIKKGHNTYESIDRENLESFSLTYRNKPFYTVRPGNRVLVSRLKHYDQRFVLSGDLKQQVLVWIVCLLAKPESNDTRQKIHCQFDPKWERQYYEIDKESSSLYYLFENSKSQINTKFQRLTPYSPLHLRPEEFKQLMGFDDPTKRKIVSQKN